MKHHIIAIALPFIIFHEVICTSPTDWHFMGTNIALHKTATQTPGTYETYSASLAVDGKTNYDFIYGHCSHTSALYNYDNRYNFAQWMVDLGDFFYVTGIIILNRKEVRERLRGFLVFGYNERACRNGWCKIYDDNGRNQYIKYKIEIEVEPVQSFSRVAINLPKHAVCKNISISHGYLQPTKPFFKVNSDAYLKCQYGYKANIQTVTCNKNIQNEIVWNIHPQCNIINCTSPEKPLNGYYTFLNGTPVLNTTDLLPFGSNIYGRCILGYENENNERRRCQSDKTWNGSQPACKRKQCSYPGNVAHGEYRFANNSVYITGPSYYNTSIHVACKQGYALQGDKERVCNDMKAWEGNSICKIINCVYPNVSNALHIEKETNGSFIHYSEKVFNYNDSINVVCREGFAFNSSSAVWKCLDTAKWSGEGGQCIQITCNELEELNDGFYTYSQNNLSTGYPYNTTVKVSCKDPFRLSNPSNTSRKCGVTGKWDNEPAVCIRPVEDDAQGGNVALYVGVSAAVVVIIIVIVVVVFFIYHRRTKGNSNKPGRPNRYAGLKRRDNHQESLSNAQDDECSEIQESRFSSISEMASPASPRDRTYINQCAVSLQTDAYYSFTNDNNVPKSAILVQDLSALIRTSLDSKRKFEKEFQELPQGMVEAHKEAMKKKNIIKNRYRNLYAYDDTRVVLKADEPSQSDYINACYVQGFNKVRQYIASQGPTEDILLDFWRMIWQEGSTKIVMLTNLVEEGVNKCVQYWPEEGTNHVYGKIKVHTEKVDIFSTVVKRIFYVEKVSNDGSKQRTITQYHFTAWPDKGVPKYASSLVQFANKVKYDPVVKNEPVIVHCSAGVGRTGTFIALDFLTEQGKELGYIDVFGTIKTFRSQRVCLVQTLDQYIFVHHALVESLMLPTSALPASKFPEAFQGLIQMDKHKKKPKLEIEFETLKKVSPVAVEGAYVSSKEVRNRRKNRYSNVLPVEEFMPSLMSKTSDDDNRYINAVFLPSYKERKAFIITQTPLENTREDFWDLIWEHDVHTIVMMNNIKETADSEKYWPETNQSLTYGSIVVTNDGVENKNHHQLLSLSAKKHKMTRKVKQIRCGGWSHNHSLPDSPEVILTLLELVKVWQRQSGHHTIVVHCMNGVDKSGLYCVISAVIERLQIEQDVAISQVTEEMRNAREQIIPSVEQYKFCHQMVLAFIHQFDTYSSFA